MEQKAAPASENPLPRGRDGRSLAGLLGLVLSVLGCTAPPRVEPTTPSPPEAMEPGERAPAPEPLTEAADALERVPEELGLQPGPVELRESVAFAVSSARLDREARRRLDRLAEALRGWTARPSVEVRGHTDATGPEADNFSLGRRRAQAVADYLSSLGVSSADSMVVLSFGSSRPAAVSGESDRRSRNRRVEVLVRRAHQAPRRR